MPAYETRASGQLDIVQEVLACLILRSPSDSLLVSGEEQQRLYTLFPQGFGIVIWGDPGRQTLRVTLVGEAARELVEDIADDLEQGREVWVPPLFGADREA